MVDGRKLPVIIHTSTTQQVLVMIYINLFFVFFSAYWAHKTFKRGDNGAGWFNLFASAINAASVMAQLVR